MKTNPIRDRSFELSKEVVLLHKYLTESKHEFILSKQLLRAGTSVGANTEEAIGGQSKKDFCFKMNIAYKEARETMFWLRIMTETDYLTEAQSKAAIIKCDEVLRLLCAILRTARSGTP
jgi:four helix bundle protein